MDFRERETVKFDVSFKASEGFLLLLMPDGGGRGVVVEYN